MLCRGHEFDWKALKLDPQEYYDVDKFKDLKLEERFESGGFYELSVAFARYKEQGNPFVFKPAPASSSLPKKRALGKASCGSWKPSAVPAAGGKLDDAPGKDVASLETNISTTLRGTTAVPSHGQSSAPSAAPAERPSLSPKPSSNETTPSASGPNRRRRSSRRRQTRNGGSDGDNSADTSGSKSTATTAAVSVNTRPPRKRA